MYDDTLACGAVNRSDTASHGSPNVATGRTLSISDDVVDAVYRDLCSFSTGSAELEKLRIRRVLEAAMPRLAARAG